MRAAGVPYREKNGLVLPPHRPAAVLCTGGGGSESKQEQAGEREEQKDGTPLKVKAFPSTPTRSAGTGKRTPGKSPTTPNTIARGNGQPEIEARVLFLIL